MTFEGLRDLFLEKHKELSNLPVGFVEEILRQSITNTQLIGLPALTDYYTTYTTLTSTTTGFTVRFRDVIVNEYIYTLPNNILFGIENPIVAIRYNSGILSAGIKTVGKFIKLSPSEYNKSLNNIMNLSALTPIYTIAGTQLKVFPVDTANKNLSIAYIRKADPNAVNVDLPDSHIPNVLNEAERLITVTQPDINLQKLKITLDTSERLKLNEVSDDAKRT